VKAGEFLRRAKKLARAQGLRYEFIPQSGKGSHGTVRLGTGFTTIKDLKKELGEGLLRSMCKDLGIERKDL
jgi:mRNA interferase HicA